MLRASASVHALVVTGSFAAAADLSMLPGRAT
jgi:hypothetical protein